MKRGLSLVLIVAFAFSLVVVGYAEPIRLSLEVDSDSVSIGDDAICVSINTDAGGYAGAVIWLYYDPDAFYLENGEDDIIAASGRNDPKLSLLASKDYPTAGKIGFTFGQATDITKTGKLVDVYFTIKAAAPTNDYDFTVSCTQMGTAAGERIESDVTTSGCTVHVDGVDPAPEITFTAQNVTVGADNADSMRQTDGSFIVPVPVIASGINAECGMAAFNFSFTSDAQIGSVTAGSAINNPDLFQVGPDGKNIWVDTNEITADNAEIAVVNLIVPHEVTAGTTYSVTVTPSDDPDNFLLVDASVYTPVIANSTVTVSVNGHVPADAVRENVVPAGCTTPGSYDEVVYCSYCNTELSRETKTIDAPGHTMTHVDAVEATTEAAGNIEYWYCTACNKYFRDAEGQTEIAQADTVIPKIAGPVKGDVNGDGKINAQDVIALMRYLVGWTDVTIDPELADYNSDGKLNNRDVYLMLKDIVDGVVS